VRYHMWLPPKCSIEAQAILRDSAFDDNGDVRSSLKSWKKDLERRTQLANLCHEWAACHNAEDPEEDTTDFDVYRKLKELDGAESGEFGTVCKAIVHDLIEKAEE